MSFTAPKARQVLLESDVSGLSGISSVRDAVELLYQSVAHEFDVLAGELGVTNINYAWGDLRRYGVTGGDTAGEQDKIQNAVDSARPIEDGGAGFGVVIAPRLSEDILQFGPAETGSLVGRWVMRSGVYLWCIGNPTFRNVTVASTDVESNPKFIYSVGNFDSSLLGSAKGTSSAGRDRVVDGEVSCGQTQITIRGPAGLGDPPNFTYTAGQTIWIQSNLNSAVGNPAFGRFNKLIAVGAVDVPTGDQVLTLKWPIDETLTDTIFVSPASGWGINANEFNAPARMLENAGIIGGTFISPRSIPGGSGGGVLNCLFQDMQVEGTRLFSYNTIQRSLAKNISGTFKGDVAELALCSYKSVIEGMNATAARDVLRVDAVSLDGENCECVFRDSQITYPDKPAGIVGSSQLLAIGGGRGNKFENVTIQLGAGYDADAVLEIRTYNDGAGGQYSLGTRDHKISNLKVSTLGNLNYYIRNFDPISSQQARAVENVIVENSEFTSASVVSGNAVHLIQGGHTLRDCLFADGDVRIGNGNVDVQSNKFVGLEMPNGRFVAGDGSTDALLKKIEVRSCMTEGAQQFLKLFESGWDETTFNGTSATPENLWDNLSDPFPPLGLGLGDSFKFGLNFYLSGSSTPAHLRFRAFWNSGVPVTATLFDKSLTAASGGQLFAAEFTVTPITVGGQPYFSVIGSIFNATTGALVSVLSDTTLVNWRDFSPTMALESYIETPFNNSIVVRELSVAPMRKGLNW